MKSGVIFVGAVKDAVQGMGERGLIQSEGLQLVCRQVPDNSQVAAFDIVQVRLFGDQVRFR